MPESMPQSWHYNMKAVNCLALLAVQPCIVYVCMYVHMYPCIYVCMYLMNAEVAGRQIEFETKTRLAVLAKMW